MERYDSYYARQKMGIAIICLGGVLAFFSGIVTTAKLSGTSLNFPQMPRIRLEWSENNRDVQAETITMPERNVGEFASLNSGEQRAHEVVADLPQRLVSTSSIS